MQNRSTNYNLLYGQLSTQLSPEILFSPKAGRAKIFFLYILQFYNKKS